MKYLLLLSALVLSFASCNSKSDSTPIGTGEVLQDYDILLTWTAVGDDGYVGQAAAYDLRYAVDSTTLRTNWNQAQLVSFLPVPSVAGTAESLATSIPLSRNQKYFFAIKTRDEAGNWAPMSNISVYVAADSLMTQKSPIQNQ